MNIYTQIKKISLKKIISPVFICLLVAALFFIIPFRPVLNPYKVDNVWEEISDIPKHQYVSTTLDKIYYSGYDIRGFANRQYSYYYSINGSRCLFFIVPSSGTPKKVLKNYSIRGKVISTSPVSAISSFDSFIENLAADLGWNATALREASLDYVISTYDYQPIIYVMIMSLLFAAFILSLYLIAVNLVHYIFPWTYPLCPHAKINNREAFINDIHNQMTNSLICELGDLYLTKKYIIEYNNERVIVLPVSKVVWAYRMGTLNYRIRHKKPKYNLFFSLCSGDGIVLLNKSSENTKILLETLRDVNDNIILGYTDAKRKSAKAAISKYNRKKLFIK